MRRQYLDQHHVSSSSYSVTLIKTRPMLNDVACDRVICLVPWRQWSLSSHQRQWSSPPTKTPINEGGRELTEGASKHGELWTRSLLERRMRSTKSPRWRGCNLGILCCTRQLLFWNPSKVSFIWIKHLALDAAKCQPMLISEQGDEKKILSEEKIEKQPQSEDPEFSWLELSAKELPVRSVDNHWIEF